MGGRNKHFNPNLFLASSVSVISSTVCMVMLKRGLWARVTHRGVFGCVNWFYQRFQNNIAPSVTTVDPIHEPFDTKILSRVKASEMSSFGL